MFHNSFVFLYQYFVKVYIQPLISEQQSLQTQFNYIFYNKSKNDFSSNVLNIFCRLFKGEGTAENTLKINEKSWLIKTFTSLLIGA